MKKKNTGSEVIYKEILNTREAASLLKVTTQTIKNYIYSGKIKALKTPGGHHRIRHSDLKGLGFVLDDEREERTLSREELWEAYAQLVDTLVKTVEAFIRALDSRDIIASGHSTRVAELSCCVGRAMGYSEKELQDLRLAALLHDVGKVGISEAILGKPGKLTDQEFFLIKQHPEIGEKIVSGIDHLSGIGSVIRHHHERFDGTGYPDKISGAAIEKSSRIIAVAGAFDFLRSDLSFRKSLSTDDALQELSLAAGTQFDPDIIDAFKSSVKNGAGPAQ